MTSQSPRIYTYKITFDEVPYYYYGVHKEKKYDEYYMGTPVANKWCWELYTPKKQILQLFDLSNEGWIEAQEVEKRLIGPVYNTDKWCLNESCGGKTSLKILRENGKKQQELGLGVHGLTKEQRIENGKVGGKRIYELGVGIHSRTKEQMSEDGKIGAAKTKELGVGIYGLSPEQRIENGKVVGKRTYELGVGIHGLSPEQKSENSKKAVQITNSQRWECCKTGYVSTAAGLVSYQKGRGIDTSKSNRRRIK